MFIVVYVKRSLFTSVQDVSTEYVGTGRGINKGLLGMIGNKGAVGVRLRIQDTYICVVNSHLAADSAMIERRNADFHEICKRLVFPVPIRYKSYREYIQSNPWMPSRSEFVVYNKKGVFDTTLSESTSVFDSDHLIWMGDLNYRVNLGEKEIKALMDAGQLSEILKFDQLNMEREGSRVFYGFEEGQVTFRPTYKFDVGTDVYDSSEKKRPPAWCDRILWLQNPLKNSDPAWLKLDSYTSCNALKSSDHKPVLAVFTLASRKVDGDKLAHVSAEINRRLDKFENDAVPDLQIDKNALVFERVEYLVPQTLVLNITNIGKVIAQFNLQTSIESDSVWGCQWLRAVPSNGALLPNESIRVELTLSVASPTLAANLNSNTTKLETILILRTLNGRDHFISITADWKPTCFGMHPEILVYIGKGIDGCPREELREIQKTFMEEGLPKVPVLQVSSLLPVLPSLPSVSSGAGAAAGAEGASESTGTSASSVPSALHAKYQMPIEIWRLTDFIYKYGMDVDNLFLVQGDESVSEYLRDCLDSGSEFDIDLLFRERDFSDSSPSEEEDDKRVEGKGEGGFEDATRQQIAYESIPLEQFLNQENGKPALSPKGRHVAMHSAARTLVTLITSLPKPLLSKDIRQRLILDGYFSIEQARKTLSILSGPALSTWMYLCVFLKDVTRNYKGRGSLEKMQQEFTEMLIPTVEEAISKEVTGLGYLMGYQKQPRTVTKEEWNRRRDQVIKYYTRD